MRLWLHRRNCRCKRHCQSLFSAAMPYRAAVRSDARLPPYSRDRSILGSCEPPPMHATSRQLIKKFLTVRLSLCMIVAIATARTQVQSTVLWIVKIKDVQGFYLVLECDPLSRQLGVGRKARQLSPHRDGRGFSNNSDGGVSQSLHQIRATTFHCASRSPSIYRAVFPGSNDPRVAGHLRGSRRLHRFSCGTSNESPATAVA
jgi:hypothetical protein